MKHPTQAPSCEKKGFTHWMFTPTGRAALNERTHNAESVATAIRDPSRVMATRREP